MNEEMRNRMNNKGAKQRRGGRKVVKTESEYAAALARIEKLMDAKRNTPQGDELELLSLLVHDYEEKAFPIVNNGSQSQAQAGDLPCRLRLPGGFRVPNRQRVGRALRADAVVSKDFVGGGDHLRPREDHCFAEARVAFDADELVPSIP